MIGRYKKTNVIISITIQHAQGHFQMVKTAATIAHLCNKNRFYRDKCITFFIIVSWICVYLCVFHMHKDLTRLPSKEHLRWQ